MRTILLDPSLLKYFACMRKVYFTSILGYVNSLPSQSIHIGSAFHVFMADYLRGKPFHEAACAALQYFDNKPYMRENKNAWKNGIYLAAMCNDFHAQAHKFPFKPVNENAIEMRIAVPYKQYPEYDCEVVLCGTMDMLAEYEGGLAIVDHKTTSAYDIRDYFESYKLNIQFPFYTVVLKRFLEEMAKSNGKAMHLLDKANAKPIATFIHGCFIKNNTSTNFKLSDPIYYPQSMLDETEHMICEAADELAKMSVLPAPPRNGILTGACHSKFGPCPFMRVCLNESEEKQLETLNIYFTKAGYNPMTHGD